LRAICVADRAPTHTLRTAGCASGNASAASGSELPWRAQTSPICRARSTRLGGDADASLFAQRQQVVERRLLEQGVAPREHQEIHVGVANEVGEHARLIHSRPDRPDHALRAELFERWIRGGEDFVVVVVGIVEVDDVHAVQPQTREALGQRSKHAFAGEVPHATVRSWYIEALLVAT
jgi:hypothetical protein